MSLCFMKRLKWLGFALPAMLLVGCENATVELSRSSKSNSPPDSTGLANRGISSAPPSSFKFESPVLLMAAGEKIDVESPGYACPTLFDLDKDGSKDLIVGQFSGGKMKWYRNLSSPSETPEYSRGEWITSADEPAKVPGVS